VTVFGALRELCTLAFIRIPCLAFTVHAAQEIADAVTAVLSEHSKLIEAAAGCAVAAFWKMRNELQGKRIVVLCCGGNIGVAALKRILDMAQPHAMAAAPA
jgi:threonine dehydratase